MTLVAILCSWYAYEMNEAAKRRKAIAEIENLGGIVTYYDASLTLFAGDPPGWFSWLRKLHGDRQLGNAVVVGLNDTELTDAGLVHLRDLPKLRFLSLTGTQITDAGLVYLEGLTNLKALSLDNTQITDAGLVQLKRLTKLEALGLSDTKVTDEGVKKLQEALPNCYINCQRTRLSAAGQGTIVTDRSIIRSPKEVSNEPDCPQSRLHKTIPTQQMPTPTVKRAHRSPSDAPIVQRTAQMNVTTNIVRRLN